MRKPQLLRASNPAPAVPPLRLRHAAERRRVRPIASGAALLALLAALASGGCKGGPDYATPEVAVPGEFSAAGAGARTVDFSRWWRILEDPELDALVERAVRANFDIAVALARVQEAREREAAAFGAAVPLIGSPAASPTAPATRR